MTDRLISIKNLSKEYFINKSKIRILKEINFELFKGDIISILGPSGSGKSTFLNILGLLDSDFIGEFEFLNIDVRKLKDYQKNNIRNNSIGFVHQFFHLIPELNVLENVSLPNLIQKNDVYKSNTMAKDILYNFGLKKRIYSKPLNLSGGEQQRVAIARALINNPDIIIADEITGNLDEKTANSTFEFFLDKIKLNKKTLVFVTHNKNFAKMADIVLEISNEQLIRL